MVSKSLKMRQSIINVIFLTSFLTILRIYIFGALPTYDLLIQGALSAIVIYIFLTVYLRRWVKTSHKTVE